jgi:hypothetical protein
MKIKATWTKTDDQLIFDCINEEVAKWFVETANQLGNNFSTADMITDIPKRLHKTDKLISEISNDIDLVNSFMSKIKKPIIDKPTNWYDQEQLNALHKDWARSRETIPTLPETLFKIDKNIFDAYQEMNCHIHLIERSFNYAFRDNTNHWRVENPFKDTFYNWQVCHLSISYPGHGRAAFEKFENIDNDVYIDDLCNWDNIDSFINMNIRRPYKLEPPQEFLEWCKKHSNLIPHTYTLPLANLENWETNLTQARSTIIKNINMPENYFSLAIV